MLIFWHYLALFGYFTQFWSVFNETQDLSFFFKVIFNRGVVFSVFRFVCLLGWPQADFFQKTAKMHRFQRNSGFKLLFQSYFQPRGRFFNFHVCLFVKLAAGLFFSKNTDGVTFCNFLPFFPSLVKRTIILVFFFSNFQGFTLLPWQKVGRI